MASPTLKVSSTATFDLQDVFAARAAPQKVASNLAQCWRRGQKGAYADFRKCPDLRLMAFEELLAL